MIITDYFDIKIQIVEVSATELKFCSSNLLNLYVGKNILELLLELETMQTQLKNKHPPTSPPPSPNETGLKALNLRKYQ